MELVFEDLYISNATDSHNQTRQLLHHLPVAEQRPRNIRQDVGEHVPGNGDVGHLVRHVSAMADDLATGYLTSSEYI